MRRICLKFQCKIDLDLFCLRVYMRRGRYLKFRRYLYLLGCVSPDVTVIPSRMQNICLKPVQLVRAVITCVTCFIVALDCVLFYLSVILRSVVCLRLVVLVVPICVSRLSQTLFDWLKVTWIFSRLFSCRLFSFIFMMFVFIDYWW